MHRRNLFAILPLVATLGFSGCEIDDWGGPSDRFKAEFSYNHPLKSGGKIYLENLNGSVELIGWEKETVDITGTRYAATDELLQQVKIDIVSDPDSIRIRTIRPSERRGNCGARYVIRLPRKALLERIESSNGSIRVESIDGDARLKTSNGAVRAWSLKGNLEASTSNGSIEVGQFEGAAVLRTSNGRIKAEGVKGFFEGRTSNGSIDATLGEMDPARPIVLDTSNSSITLSMERWNNNEIRADTSNGSVNLRLPPSVSARVHAATSSGSITNEFEIKTRTVSKNLLEGSIGDGGALIDLSTSNGSIRITKR